MQEIHLLHIHLVTPAPGPEDDKPTNQVAPILLYPPLWFQLRGEKNGMGRGVLEEMHSNAETDIQAGTSIPNRVFQLSLLSWGPGIRILHHFGGDLHSSCKGLCFLWVALIISSLNLWTWSTWITYSAKASFSCSFVIKMRLLPITGLDLTICLVNNFSSYGPHPAWLLFV